MKGLWREATPNDGERKGDEKTDQSLKEELAVSDWHGWIKRDSSAVQVTLNDAKGPSAV